VTATERADGYLTIPAASAEELDGVQWSHRCDALELADGTTLALVGEVALVLEGVFSRPRVPPFAHVLNLLVMLKRGDAAPEVARLRRAWAEAKRAAVVHRNVGLLLRELCGGLPPAPAAPTWEELSNALARRELFGERRRPELADVPALSRAAFELRVRDRLRRLDDAALTHWLTHGCGPTDAGGQLAEPVETLPVRVARLLAAARTRPRLVGAAVLVPALDAGLTIPPRRRSPDAVPQGGYADVTTRGQPEHLLPGQFALDPDEFVRRFAERELLYFRREEPHTAQKPERVIVLDQGVRTWGGVRLALAAAALSLLRRDPKRLGPAQLVLTSADGPIDPAGLDVEALADRLEASDLTPDPGGALGRAVREPTAAPRDLILLTHPRALREPAVAAAAKDRRPVDRLFALTADEAGRAELCEWADGAPATVRAFRVDLAAAEAARPDAPTARPLGEPVRSTWTGDVEPVPFPFRPGLVAEATGLGFDVGGEWLVTAGRDGVLHGLSFDGSPPEVLPRAFHDGAVLKQVEAILGVPDGVVVCGRLTPLGHSEFMTVLSVGDPIVVSAAVPSLGPVQYVPPDGQAQFVAAHYDRAHRQVTVYPFGPAVPAARWSAFPELGCVVLRRPLGSPVADSCALDLATRDRYLAVRDDGQASRTRDAWRRSASRGSPPYALSVMTRWTPWKVASDDEPYLLLSGNTVHVKRADPPWVSFEPRRDGKPLLAGASIHKAQLAGDVLALHVCRGSERRLERSLIFFHGPEGAAAGAERDAPRDGQFTLSADGRRVVFVRKRRDVAVKDVPLGPPLAVASPARLHDNVEVGLNADPFRLAVRVGTFEHVFLVADGRLRHAFVRRATAPPRPVPAPDRLATAYDPARFLPHKVVAAGPWRAAVDRLGQVVLSRQDGTVVAAVLVRRDRAAVWAPGDVFWGAPDLIGGPPTPDAERTIGQAIRTVGG
jgi:hypothetical protein